MKTKINLVGQRFNLKATQHTYKDRVYTTYELDDPVMEQKIHDMYGDEVRIFPPGTLGTCDWQPYRTNVYIDEHSIITEVTKG